MHYLNQCLRTTRLHWINVCSSATMAWYVGWTPSLLNKTQIGPLLWVMISLVVCNLEKIARRQRLFILLIKHHLPMKKSRIYLRFTPSILQSHYYEISHGTTSGQHQAASFNFRSTESNWKCIARLLDEGPNINIDTWTQSGLIVCITGCLVTHAVYSKHSSCVYLCRYS